MPRRENPDRPRAAGAAAAPVVEARAVHKTFGSQTALHAVDLEIARGEALGLLGPNGAGKTTMIRILSTLARPSSGSVRVLGLDPERDAARIRAKIGVVPQEIAIYDGLTARENLYFFGRMQSVAQSSLAARVQWALDVAGLVERADDRVGSFSGGMKRRLNIVASLLHEPELVFLDEPTVGIDPQSRNHVYEMVAGLHATGVTIVYTTHQLGEVERLCDRIVILDKGNEIARGTLLELQRKIPGSGRRGLRVMGDRVVEARAVLTEAGIASEIEEELPGLEQVFLALTGHALRDGRS
ncbi:MAG: ABC transporter ATP-binding protein [Planctomycetes bacterium]|nr:ABC transporter ATP-binding protein [Planctomycetota bacterium]